jgi:hypothetical protein
MTLIVLNKQTNRKNTFRNVHMILYYNDGHELHISHDGRKLTVLGCDYYSIISVTGNWL